MSLLYFFEILTALLAIICCVLYKYVCRLRWRMADQCMMLGQSTFDEDIRRVAFMRALVYGEQRATPFYDKPTTSSTITFVKAFRRIEKEVPGTKTQLLFLPNNINRKGNLEEKKVWKQNVDTFDMVGTVLPMIPSRAVLERFDTVEITAPQRDVVKNTFEEIVKLINE